MEEEIKSNSLQCIADVFTKHGMKFKTGCGPDREALLAGFKIENGPNLLVYFVVPENSETVSVRVYDILTNVSNDRRSRILEACNLLNRHFRFLKYCLASDNSVELEYDFPNAYSENIGDICLMFMQVIMYFADTHYEVLMKALHTEAAIIYPDGDGAVEGPRYMRISDMSDSTGMLS